jgi:hypothetical protein
MNSIIFVFCFVLLLSSVIADNMFTYEKAMGEKEKLLAM